MLSHSPHTIACLNCGNKFAGKYCNQCGQKADTHRFSVGHVLHELPHQLLHLDKGIFKNIRSLVQPRQAVQEYLRGRRISYFNPLLFFFLTLGVILFLEHSTDKIIRLMLDMKLDLGPVDTPQYDAGPFLNRNLRYLFFALAFIMAVPNYFLYRKETGYNYAEQVLAATFVLGFTNLCYLALIWLSWVRHYPASPVFYGFFLLFSALIFYRGKWWLTALKALLALMATSLLFLLALLLLWAIRLGVFLVLEL